MDLRRLRAGEWLAAASGVALLVSLFLPWYQPEVCLTHSPGYPGGTDCPSLSGWEALAAVDVLLAFIAASGVLVGIVTAVQRVPAVPIATSALVMISGTFGVLLVLFRVIDLPDGAAGREWALWLGLAGALGIAAGAFIAMRDEIRPGATRPDIPVIPAPRL
jgi:hypothetical protein